MKVLAVLLLVVKVFAEECLLDLSNPDSPFIVTDQFEWPKYNSTENQTLAFSEGDQFYVVCPKGTHNIYLGPTGSPAKCVGGTNITIDESDPIDFVDIVCKPPTPTNVTKTEGPCTGGTLYEVGFNVDENFITMAKVCFDTDQLTPIYCQFNNTFNLTDNTEDHIQLSNSDGYYESYICNGTACEWADGGNLFSAINIDNIYLNQTNILADLVGGNETVLRFPLTTTNLWYLNVVNDGQEIQKIPYYDYVNVVPLFDTDLVDVFLYFLDITLGSGKDIGPIVTIGTFGVASNNDSGTDLFLNTEDKNVPIPKWIWVLFDITKKISLYYNGPSSEEGDTEIIDICNDHTYDVPNIFTCHLDNVTKTELMDIINDLPETS